MATSYLVDLKTGSARRSPSTSARVRRSRCRPAASTCCISTRRRTTGSPTASPTASRVNLTEKLGLNFWREDHDTPSLPPAYGTAGWTADDRSVLLYDKYDIWEVRPDGSGARMVTNGDGRKQQIVFRYRSLDPEQRAIPGDRPLLLSANEDRTEDSGFYRVALNGSAAPEKIVMLDEGVRTDHEGEECRPPGRHRVPLRRVPGSVGDRHQLPRHEEGVERQPAAGGLRLGQDRADQVPQRRRQGAARDPGQARQLRSGEEVPADGLHLRGAVGGAAQLPRAQRRAPASTSRATSATATSCCMPDIVYDTGYPGRERREVRDPGGQRDRREGLHRPEADRHPGALVGRLPDHAPDHPHQHVRRGAGRRLGVEHDQRLRRHPVGHRHVPRVPVPRRPRAASARRHGTRRCSSSRTRRSSGSRR